jgi:hypothetical protein
MRVAFVVGLIVCGVLASSCAANSTESGEPAGATVVINGNKASITNAGYPTEAVSRSAIELFSADGVRMDIAEGAVGDPTEDIIKCEKCECNLNTGICTCTNCIIE